MIRLLSFWLLLSLTGCSGCQPFWHHTEDADPPRISLDTVGPWLTIDQTYNLTVHLIGKPYQFFDKTGDSDLDIRSKTGLINSRVLVLKTFSDTQTVPLKLKTVEVGNLHVRIIDSSDKLIAEASQPYVSDYKDQPLLVDEQKENYVVTFNPDVIPKAFSAYYNEVSLGFFTSDEQLFLPKTTPKNVLLLIELDVSSNETQKRIQFQIP